MFPLDQRHGPAAIGQLLRQGVPGLAGADYDGVVLRHRQHSFLQHCPLEDLDLSGSLQNRPAASSKDRAMSVKVNDRRLILQQQ